MRLFHDLNSKVMQPLTYWGLALDKLRLMDTLAFQYKIKSLLFILDIANRARVNLYVKHAVKEDHRVELEVSSLE